MRATEGSSPVGGAAGPARRRHEPLRRWLGRAGLASLAGLAAGTALTASAPWFWLGEVAANLRWQLGWASTAVVGLLGLGARPRAALAAALLCAWHLGPSLALWIPADDAQGSGPEITVASANVCFTNFEYGAVADWIRSERPDVVALTEINDAWLAGLAALRSEYPHVALLPERADEWHTETAGRAILSRGPIRWSAAHEGHGGAAGFLEAEIELGGRLLHVVTVHPHRPGKPWRLEKRDAALRQVARDARWRADSVLLGDLNTTPYSSQWRPLLDATALRDARQGFGRMATFTTAAPIRGLSVDIDHVLIGPALAARAFRTPAVPGSDHRAVVARLRWRDA